MGEENMLPISAVVEAGDYVFLSGIPPIEEGRVVFPGDAAKQTEFLIRRMKRILSLSELSLDHLVYVQVYLKRIQEAEIVNAVYERMMPRPYPARKLVTTDFSAEGVCLEINGIAYRNPKQSKSIS